MEHTIIINKFLKEYGQPMNTIAIKDSGGVIELNLDDILWDFLEHYESLTD